MVFVGCGPQPKDAPADTAAQASPKATNAAGVPATKHTIEAYDNMKFSQTLIEVPAGQEITINFVNAGHMPKDKMGHNLVILQLGKNPNVFMAEAAYARESEYIPTVYEDWILAHSPLLGGGQSAKITFTAPAIPGEYPFICTFPGHYAVGMKGVMRVVVEAP